jgi:hypothetical protein
VAPSTEARSLVEARRGIRLTEVHLQRTADHGDGCNEKQANLLDDLAAGEG